MVQPSLNTEVYAAIHPDNFKGHFKGRLVVVTGAGRGIGRHIALGFAKAGATLALLDFDIESQEETKKLCEAEGGKVYLYACDVTKYYQCVKTVGEIENLGTIDILVNNAGGGPIRGFVSQSFDEFWGGVEQNFKGVSNRNLLVSADTAGYDNDAFGSPGHEGAEEGLYHQHCLQVSGPPIRY